ncbi:hypothetical protein ABZ419_02580 [Streptomyces cinnamoneus]|uniref:hypothetical protein n=1 Tax=Streptomyces cinnamoneus TaxID=53446 RepID=UPI00340777CD
MNPNQEVMQGRLDEFEPPIAWYLCGVTRKWATNAHLAFETAPGDQHELQVQGLHVTLTDARPILFGPEAVPADDPHAGDRAFMTCRNWQFAHHLAKERGLKSIGNPPSRGRRSTWVRGQMPLM